MLDRHAGPPQDQSARVTRASGMTRVLIVDDNQGFVELLVSALDSVQGVACVGTASSAVEGFRRVVELEPSVVVMDIMMPGLDGLAATTRLRQICPDTAIAVASAHSENEWIARARDAGASAYIPKGGSLTELLEVLRAARPGSMIVPPSLESAWSSWEPPEPGPGSAPAEPPAPPVAPARAVGGPLSILRARTQRAKRDVARRLTAASRARRAPTTPRAVSGGGGGGPQPQGARPGR